MASICLISDTHGLHRMVKIPPCDILIHAGDFSTVGKSQLITLQDADAWFAEAPANHVVCIAGNHDFPLQRKEFQFRNAQCIEDRLIEVDGLSIYGSPWCPDLSGFAYYATGEELMERWEKIPQGIDILITHTPPQGILDKPTSGKVNLGCPHLRHELRRIRPRLHVFGHIHASHGTFQHGPTRSVNAAIVGGSNFEVRHSPTLIEMA